MPDSLKGSLETPVKHPAETLLKTIKHKGLAKHALKLPEKTPLEDPLKTPLKLPLRTGAMKSPRLLYNIQ